MNKIRIAFVVMAVVAVGTGQEAAAQKGDLDVTMRVLDDVRGIDAVILAIGGAAEETAAREESKDHAAPRGEAASDAKSGAHDEVRPDDALEPRDEDQVEGALEDHDRAEDLEEPAPAAPLH